MSSQFSKTITIILLASKAITLLGIESVIWVQILDEAVCVSLCANTLGKGMNPFTPPPSYGQIVGQIGFFIPHEATNLGERKLWIQTPFFFI